MTPRSPLGWWTWPALGLLPCATAMLAAEPIAKPPPALITEVRVERLDGSVRTDVQLASRLVSYALPKQPGGRREILLLVGPDAAPAKPTEGKPPEPCTREPSAGSEEKTAPLRLLRLDPNAPGSVTELRQDIPGDAAALDSVDLDGDGREELLLFRPGGIYVLPEAGGMPYAGGPDPLVLDPDLAESALEPRIARYPGIAMDRTIGTSVTGALRSFGPKQEGGEWGLLSEIPLPLIATRAPHTLFIFSPRLSPIDRKPNGGVVWATHPEPYGKDRLRTWLLDPAAAEPARALECWSKLPAPERLIESSFVMLDGAPTLAVTTTSAEKLSLFGEKQLRVFPLKPDRTRSGIPPVFSVETHANLWQMAGIHALDVDRDGRQDLVLSYWKGLKDTTVVLEVYLRLEDGSFGRSPRTTSFDVEAGEQAFLGFGDDLDGDGIADLLLLADKNVQIFPGEKDCHGGKALVSPKPRERAALPSKFPELALVVRIGTAGIDSGVAARAISFPRPVDLEGDGRREILLAGNPDGAHGRFVLFRFAQQPTGR